MNLELNGKESKSGGAQSLARLPDCGGARLELSARGWSTILNLEAASRYGPTVLFVRTSRGRVGVSCGV